MAFREVREYQPGDDVRTIDWNVTARMDETFVKMFVEEREHDRAARRRRLGIERFGSRIVVKQRSGRRARRGARVLGHGNHDRVGAIMFSDRIERYIAPARGSDHVLRIVRDLLVTEPQGTGTDLDGALRFAYRVMKRRGIVAVISDFQAGAYQRALGMLRRRHDVIAIHLHDPRESEFPPAGLVALSGPRDRRAARGGPR